MHQTARTDLMIGQPLSPLLRAQSPRLVHLGSGEKERVSVGSVLHLLD
jgi:hypothetical protein